MLRLTSGLHLVVNPLYLLCWIFLLVVDFATDTPIPLGAYSSSGNSCEVFLHQENNSSAIYHSCFLWSSGPWDVPKLTSEVVFFLTMYKMYQTVALATLNVFTLIFSQIMTYSFGVTALWTSYNNNNDN